MAPFVAVVLATWLFGIFAGGAIGAMHGRPYFGVALGLFLGPAGVVAAGLLPDTALAAAQRDVAKGAVLRSRYFADYFQHPAEKSGRALVRDALARRGIYPGRDNSPSAGEPTHGA